MDSPLGDGRHVRTPNKHLECPKAGRVRELKRSSRSEFKMVSHQFNTVQFPSNQFVWKVRSVQLGTRGPKCLRSVQFIQFRSQTLPALALIDPTRSVRFSLGSVHRIPNCLGAAEEQFYVPSSGNPSPPARGLSPRWRDGRQY